jgi:hypothetical protein
MDYGSYTGWYEKKMTLFMKTLDQTRAASLRCISVKDGLTLR